MSKFLAVILAIFEFLFYTFFMVLIGSVEIENSIIKVIVHFIGLTIISILLYFIMKFILKKLKMEKKKYLYIIPICNLIMGLILPVLIIAIIPSEALATIFFLIMVGTVYYGIIVNILILVINGFFNKEN